MTKQITIKQINDLLTKADWIHSQEIELIDSNIKIELDENSNEIEKEHCYGFSVKTSRFGGFVITYTETLNYIKGEPESFNANTEHQSEVYTINHIQYELEIIDDYDQLTNADNLNIDWPESFNTIDYSEFKQDYIE